ncbi:thiolase-like protein [Xylaria flabelliformis]|nr:thiolase-like protein [Xylaria flabelliformis]
MVVMILQVKTVIGHTEGTAGLASLLKVSLALQFKKIPPNLHLNRLSATVRPHCKNLEIPTSLRSWPEVEGQTRRASVNSFGFGGAVSTCLLNSSCFSFLPLPTCTY